MFHGCQNFGWFEKKENQKWQIGTAFLYNSKFDFAQIFRGNLGHGSKFPSLNSAIPTLSSINSVQQEIQNGVMIALLRIIDVAKDSFKKCDKTSHTYNIKLVLKLRKA